MIGDALKGASAAMLMLLFLAALVWVVIELTNAAAGAVRPAERPATTLTFEGRTSADIVLNVSSALRRIEQKLDALQQQQKACTP